MQCIHNFVYSISHYRYDSIFLSRFVLLIGRAALSEAVYGLTCRLSLPSIAWHEHTDSAPSIEEY
jgi:hypothetical protein